MKPLIIVIGLCLIAAGTGLQFLGHYDGVLGAADPQRVLSHESTRDATARLVVAGTPSEASQQFGLYRAQLVIPAPMSKPLEDGQWVPVRVEGTDAQSFLKVDGPTPQPGTLLVFYGDIHSFWPVYDAGTSVVSTQPILFLEAHDYHAPILFKA